MQRIYTERELNNAEKWYKENRHLLNSGEVCRIIGINAGNFSRWVNDKPQFNGSAQKLSHEQRVKLAGIRNRLRK